MALIGFWVLAGLITVAVVVALRPRQTDPQATSTLGDGDIEPARRIYRDQLSEVEADQRRGLITGEEALAARLEIERRLLATDVPAQPPEAPGKSAISMAATVMAVVLPLAALALYISVGTPGAGDHPHRIASERSADERTLSKLITQVEERLRQFPEEGRGWDLIAPFYLRQERFADAITAFGNAIRLLGESPARLQGLGEAHVFNDQGKVGDEARKVFARALFLAPGSVEPRLWLAIGKEQDGKLAEAVQEYRAMLAGAPADAPWREAVEDRARQVEAIMTGASAKPAPAKGPTTEDIAAAQKLAPEQRLQMIEQMVAGLAARLKSDGRDAEGWQKLVRAYVVLGRRDEALRALAEGRVALGADKTGLGQLNELAQSLGLGS